MVICLERCADLHMAQLMPLPLTVSCFSKIQTGFTFLVLAHLGSPRKRAGVCVVNPRRITALMLPKLWHQQLLISSCCPHPGCGIWQTSINSQQAANQLHQTNAQTDRRTDTLPLQRCLVHTMRSSSVT